MNYLIIVLKLCGLGILYPLIALIIFRKSCSWRIFESVISLLFVYILVYFFLPNSYGAGLNIFITQTSFLALVMAIDTSMTEDDNTTFLERKLFDICRTSMHLLFYLFIIGVILRFCVGIYNTKSNAYSVNVTTYKNTDSAPMPKIISDSKELPVVNSNSTVRVQTQNSLSKVPNSNVYNLDHMRVQFYKGKLVYIAPLDFDGGYLKYRHYKKVPGYFIVDATKKDATPKFVKQNLTYTPSAYFEHDAYRKLYQKASESRLVLAGDTPQLEITDNNTPYYVTTAVKCYGSATNHLDFSHYWVVTVNAVNGKTALYSTKNKPKWLDVAVTPNVAKAALSQYTEFRNGWWNRRGWFGYQYGVMVPLEEVGTEANGALTPIAYKGKIFYFGTLTSAKGNQTSVLAYAYIDAETGKIYLYKEQSATMTPDRAESLAENQMKQTQWKATMPLLYRIAGYPTWVVSMVDQNKAFQGYVYLKANGNGTQDTIAKGSNARDTLNKYRSLLNGTLSTAQQSKAGVKITKVGSIYRVARYNDNNLRFMLKGSTKVYNVSINDFPDVIFLRPNDKIKVTGVINDDVVAVTNLSYSIDKGKNK